MSTADWRKVYDEDLAGPRGFRGRHETEPKARSKRARALQVLNLAVDRSGEFAPRPVSRARGVSHLPPLT